MKNKITYKFATRVLGAGGLKHGNYYYIAEIHPYNFYIYREKDINDEEYLLVYDFVEGESKK